MNMATLSRPVRHLIAVILLLSATAAHAQAPPQYVGTAACTGCHADQAARWQDSHHARAMQPATPATVLGDFTGGAAGAPTRFFREGDAYMVHTEGPDGTPRDYKIDYTFGVDPLQQYLIAFPGGRYQALGTAWDSRAREQGGQRWFSLYPDPAPHAGDPLHWTGRDQTWNYQCANCHSTDLRKNFDLATNSYATTWSDVNVACEACHGPGSNHIAWVQGPPAEDAGHKGLTAWLRPNAGEWVMNPQTGIAQRSEKLVSGELDVCAGCHARRKVIAGNPVPGGKFLDSYLAALLEPGLYHADGQIDGEVFEYGSFVQSRMFRAGVTCTDCHEPHTATLRAEGNGLCAQCHMPAKFDTADHTHHAPGSTGAQCANCHMPTKTYMIVDVRRDHSIRVPRPDLSVALGTPNACTTCHTDRTAEWAAEAVARWFPGGRQTQPHYATALHAGRTDAANAEVLLDALVLDTNQPAIARASALPMLAHGTAASSAAVRAAIADPDALLRMAAPRAFSAALSASTAQTEFSLLRDPVRAVRIEAARALSGADPRTLTPAQQSALAAAYAELVTAEMTDAERPETHLNLGLLDLRRQQPGEAEAEYTTALRLDPSFVPAMVNLADLDRARGQDRQGEALLTRALALEPQNADVRYAMGLLLVRRHDYAQALPMLHEANTLAPDNARYAYVYAVALNQSGDAGGAIALLERTHQAHPGDWDVLSALTALTRQSGDGASALRHAREMAALRPADPQVRALVKSLEDPAPR